MKRIIPILIFILLFSCTSSQRSFNFENEIHGIVSKVVDGDTVYVSVMTNTLKVRLADIDAPEKKQQYGQEAKIFVKNLSLNKEVVIHLKGIDRYGRTIGTVVVVTNGANLNQELLKNGWAYWYKQYSTNVNLGILEGQARSNKMGIWASTNNNPPWEWRRKNKH